MAVSTRTGRRVSSRTGETKVVQAFLEPHRLTPPAREQRFRCCADHRLAPRRTSCKCTPHCDLRIEIDWQDLKRTFASWSSLKAHGASQRFAEAPVNIHFTLHAASADWNQNRRRPVKKTEDYSRNGVRARATAEVEAKKERKIERAVNNAMKREN